MTERARPLLYPARTLVSCMVSTMPLSPVDKLPVGYLLPEKRDADGRVVINPDTGRPQHTWLPFTEALPDDTWLVRWFLRTDTRMAAIMGKVSGNAETLDFDHDLSGGLAHFDRWWSWLLARDTDLAARLLLVRTPSDGRHVVFRCPETGIPRNHVVARQYVLCADDPSRDVVKTLVETRGEHGYVVAPPSAGYRALRGTYRDVPVISSAEHALLHELAAALTIGAPRPQPDRAAGASAGQAHEGDAVWDRYNDAASNEDTISLLAEIGWTDAGADGAGKRVRRPGAESTSSGTVGINRPGWLHCFSSNAGPFEPDKNYSPFQIYAIVRCGGDYRAAARALWEAERAAPLAPPAVRHTSRLEIDW
jgi:hypothetical protein